MPLAPLLGHVFFVPLELDLQGALIVLHPADADKLASTLQAKLPKLVGQRTNFLVGPGERGAVQIFSVLPNFPPTPTLPFFPF